MLSPQSSTLPVAFERSVKVGQGAIGRIHSGWGKRLRQHRVARTEVAGQRPPLFSSRLVTARHHEATALLIIALPGAWTSKLALKHSSNTVIPSPCVGTIIEFETGMIVLFNAQRADSSNSCILQALLSLVQLLAL